MPVPCSIAAGATLLFTETLSGYPATGFTLQFALNFNGVATVISATASGIGFVVTAAGSVTAAWSPGRYFWSEVVTETATSIVTQLCTGQLSVTPNFAVDAVPTSSQVQLATLDTAISGLLANPNSSVSFNGQSFTARNLTELFDVRDRLQARVTAELRAADLTTRGGVQRIATRF